jgi:hypothetical protein
MYPTTVSAWDRLDSSHLENEDRQQLREITRNVIQWFCSDWSNFELPPHDAEGLVQHLGLPTRYIDFSKDPEVATAFGVCGSETCLEGRVCVLDVQSAVSGGRGQIAEFCTHPWCERAKRQAAYGYGPIQFQDLKQYVAPHEFVQWNENVERDWSLRYWSQTFGETLRSDYLSRGRADRRGIFVFPATHHPSGIRPNWLTDSA